MARRAAGRLTSVLHPVARRRGVGGGAVEPDAANDVRGDHDIELGLGAGPAIVVKQVAEQRDIAEPWLIPVTLDTTQNIWLET